MEINKKDLEVFYTKGTGPGGQHKNKTYSCVVIRHLPTGIEERCEDTRSKNQNYKIAYDRIEKRVNELIEKQKHEQLNKIRNKEVFDTTNGSKVIRTYNQKRNEVKDYRSGKKAPMDKFLDGNLDLLK